MTNDLVKQVAADLENDDGSLRRKMAEIGIAATGEAGDQELRFEAIDRVRLAYLYLYVCASRGIDIDQLMKESLGD